ncbi:DUF4132 domain-containing protein [Hymenobacter sp. 15J16-1T3B]|uniref:DUF4132 domain-containing protein n=1 Tax=Hymenobacter sp. 15J16-1T3B TaxID=2886941 RepID=UPI001D0F8D81|nr:DUF4132 domain-containing protein [Hymenobacter sp. 15J16-1T3B]MCC3156644.1 DUF4132 domain-containing protein [Hymenobacter sp. 15J16-1T3B]
MPATQKSRAFEQALAGPSVEAQEMQPVLRQLLLDIEERQMSYYTLKLLDVPAYQGIREQDAAYKGRLALATAEAIRFCRDHHGVVDYQIRNLLEALLQQLLRSTLELDAAGLIRLLETYGIQFPPGDAAAEVGHALFMMPVLLTLGQVEKFQKKHGPHAELTRRLGQLLAATEHQDRSYGGGTIVKIRLKLQELLGGPASAELPPVQFVDGDAFGRRLNEFVAGLSPSAASTRPWLQLLQLWQKAGGGQPTAKFRKEADAAVAAIGPEAVRAQAAEWLALLAGLAVEQIEHTHTYEGGRTYTYSEWHFLLEPSLNVAKGLVWTLGPTAPAALQQQLAELALKGYRKIPGRGPLASGLANACLLALAQGGLPGVAQLSRLRPKIRQANTQELIGRHIEKASQELGVTPAEIEDMAVPTAGLVNGRADFDYGDYHVVLELAEGKAEVSWQKGGKTLKAAPAALKQSHAAELKELKVAQTQAQQTYTGQRDRLDRSFVEARRMPFAWFRQYYLEHGLLSQLAERLIWRFAHPDGTQHDALWLDGAWRNAQEHPLPAPADEAQVQLWHPVLATTDEVLAWRALLERRELRQPLKQAFREVYLLTPPEERTRTYSNRMAAHVLKQHQFNSLAKLRGWRYALMGAYDKGYESDAAQLSLPAHDLRAEFWVSEVNADGAWNDTGIWHYVSTDQLRFTRLAGQEPLPLTDIPPLVFSEVMRDVDLFVGVASVGNDPLWRDGGGLVQYRNYWENYSFGELSEVAKNRKLALQRLVPRLRIAKVSEIQDRFLVVKGKLRTYKIHLGSGNILMEPNDQYLCIVPDRSPKQATATDVFLPFEGDAILSIILSKALLLADDDKITDETITRQIKR